MLANGATSQNPKKISLILIPTVANFTQIVPHCIDDNVTDDQPLISS
jgi:hypothetical protein